MLKQRLRNKAFILSCIGFAALVYKTATGAELPASFDTLVNVGLTMLTGLGILIDPTTPGITDCKEE
jgi:phi LC3 family holin